LTWGFRHKFDDVNDRIHASDAFARIPRSGLQRPPCLLGWPVNSESLGALAPLPATQSDRQTDRQTDRKTDRQTDTDRQTLTDRQ